MSSTNNEKYFLGEKHYKHDGDKKTCEGKYDQQRNSIQKRTQ